MRHLVFLAILLSMNFTASAQTTWYVPDDFSTIQGALSDVSVVDGDTVIVRPGTYMENIDFIGKAINVKSEMGPAVTTIDGGNPVNPDHGSVVMFHHEEGSDSVLDGFRLTNGTGTRYEWYPGAWIYGGGGIFCHINSSPTILNNIITRNSALGFGGGIHCDSCSPTIANNTISMNSSGHDGGGIECYKSSPTITRNIISLNLSVAHGGGILCDESSPVITKNTITENSCHLGGGIYCMFSSSAVIEGNTITKNWATGNHGGGIGCYDSSATISDNILSENSATTGGGGIYFGSSSGEITNNNITKNSAEYGGGISGNSSIDMAIRNNIVTENSATMDGGGIHGSHFNGHITKTLIAHNSSGDDGGGIYLNGGFPDITNVTISRNKATDDGGGIFCFEASPIFTNITIVENSAGDQGGGIFCTDGFPVMTNSILWINTVPAGWQQICLFGSYNIPSSFTIRHSDVMGGKGSVIKILFVTLNWNAGMTSHYPYFVDMAKGDYHLTYGSPCKDTGLNTVGNLPAEDMEGDPRIAYGTVDMGSDEFYPHLYYTGDATPSSAIEAKFVGLPGTSINGVLLGINIFDPPLPCDYGLWYMDNPFQVITGLGAIPPTGIAVFPGTIPAVPPAPYTFYLQGVIDMELTNLCPVQVE